MDYCLIQVVHHLSILTKKFVWLVSLWILLDKEYSCGARGSPWKLKGQVISWEMESSKNKIWNCCYIFSHNIFVALLSVPYLLRAAKINCLPQQSILVSLWNFNLNDPALHNEPRKVYVLVRVEHIINIREWSIFQVQKSFGNHMNARRNGLRPLDSKWKFLQRNKESYDSRLCVWYV